MKKNLFYLLTISLLISVFTGCQRKKVDMNTKVRVVASIYPIYDWTRNLLEEQSNNTLLLSMVIKNGMDSHSYKPEQTDINQIINSGLIIYTGGESDKWIEDALKASPNEKRIEIKLMDLIDEPSIDEHIWMSPKNAVLCCNEITTKLCQLDSENTEKYIELNKAYIDRLIQLDSDYQFTADNATQKTLLICDRFPFYWLTKTYGYDYIAVFENCSADTNVNPEKVKLITDKIGELDIRTVFVTESSDKKISRTVIATSAHPMSDTYILDSMQTTTLAQAFKGKGYVETMYKNLEEIKKAVN